MKKTLLAACTPQQEQVLKKYEHLFPFSYLDDGDLLVIDAQDMRRFLNPSDPTTLRLGPYVLTQNGYLQDVTHHFLTYHDSRFTNHAIHDTLTPYQIPFTEWDGQVLSHPTRQKTISMPPRKLASIQNDIRRLADELSRSLYASKKADLPTIHSPTDAADLLMPILSTLDREEFWTLCLNTRNKVIHVARIYSGSVNSSMIRVAEVLRPAILENSNSIILAHNHPSGDPTPSPEDVSTTRSIVSAGKLMDISVLDHIVIGDNKWVSLKERGLGFG